MYECGRGCLNTSHKQILTEYILHVWEAYIRGFWIWLIGYILGISHDYVTSTALLGSSTLQKLSSWLRLGFLKACAPQSQALATAFRLSQAITTLRSRQNIIIAECAKYSNDLKTAIIWIYLQDLCTAGHHCCFCDRCSQCQWANEKQWQYTLLTISCASFS